MDPLTIPKYIPPEFSKFFDLSFIFTTPVLLVLLGLFGIGYAVASSALIYHWYSYGMKSMRILLVEVVYLLVSFVLFLFAFMSVMSY